MSWWLRGHIFVVLIIGLLSYGVINHHGATTVLPHKQRGTIVYESPTRVLPTISAGRTPTVRTTVRATVKPTVVPTVVTAKTRGVATPTVQPVASNYVGDTPSCYYHPTQFYGQNGEQGTDFGCGYHTGIIALWDGKVQYAGKTCWNSTCTSTSGGVVITRSYVPGLGTESVYYLHLDTANVKVGSAIKKGTVVGLSGGQTTGGNWPASPWFSSGPHLEVGFDASFLCQNMVYCSGKNVNPLTYIQEAIR